MHWAIAIQACLILTDASVSEGFRDLGKVAPEVGFEPTTNRLTADRSTTELLRSVVGQDTNQDLGRFKRKL
jgi:hypothetical protein